MDIFETFFTLFNFDNDKATFLGSIFNAYLEDKGSLLTKAAFWGQEVSLTKCAWYQNNLGWNLGIVDLEFDTRLEHILI